jgi:hypothetical protein
VKYPGQLRIAKDRCNARRAQIVLQIDSLYR